MTLKTEHEPEYEDFSGRAQVSPNAGFLRNPLLGRVALGLALILVTLIPLGFVKSIVRERGQLYQEVVARMSGEWGGAQQISGPILTVPFEYTEIIDDALVNKTTNTVSPGKRSVTRTETLFILPEKLEIRTKLDADKLKRSIYTVPIYSSVTTLEGNFKWPDTSALNHKPDKILWDRADLVVLIADTKAIQSGTELVWNSQPAELIPGIGLAGTTANGLHSRLGLTSEFEKTPIPFALRLSLRGSGGFSYAPTGKESSVKLQADWKDPSFKGALLPSTRDVGKDKFSAEWSASYLSRPYEQFESLAPEAQTGFLAKISGFNFGVDLFQTVDLYVLINRTAKYGVMFISLTFFSIFIIEFASNAKLHWIQHLIIGAALCMFYLCVLAFSEHIPFPAAYAIGVALITVIIGWYAWIAMGKAVYGIILGSIMLALYATLYSILQMEDYALLIGTLLLLAFLVMGMFVTRNMGQKNSQPQLSA